MEVLRNVEDVGGWRSVWDSPPELVSIRSWTGAAS
jgi:hypothetical protein